MHLKKAPPFLPYNHLNISSDFSEPWKCQIRPCLGYVLFQPIRHVRVINCPRFFNLLVFVPVIFIAIKKLLSMTLILNNLVSFKSVLVPIIILLTIAFSLISSVNCHIRHPPYYYSLLFLNSSSDS